MGLAFITFGVIGGLNARPLSGAHLSSLILIAGGGFLIVRVIQVARRALRSTRRRSAWSP
jgi:hypothetical protein